MTTLVRRTFPILLPELRWELSLASPCIFRAISGSIIWLYHTIKISGEIEESALIGWSDSVSALFQWGTTEVPITDADGSVLKYETTTFAKVVRMLQN
jgi:type II secretory pathway component PulC